MLEIGDRWLSHACRALAVGRADLAIEYLQNARDAYLDGGYYQNAQGCSIAIEETDNEN